jgi:hypothetical protein
MDVEQFTVISCHSYDDSACIAGASRVEKANKTSSCTATIRSASKGRIKLCVKMDNGVVNDGM